MKTEQRLDDELIDHNDHSWAIFTEYNKSLSDTGEK